MCEFYQIGIMGALSKATLKIECDFAIKKDISKPKKRGTSLTFGHPSPPYNCNI
jgi:hypothetical protein